MPFTPFQDRFPELARNEMRIITVLGPDQDVPEDSYGLMELYCDEPGCDCRRVMLSVMSQQVGRLEAVIAFGWESSDFYRGWSSFDDPEAIEHMMGPVLNLGSPVTDNSGALLRLVSEEVLSQPSYVARLKRHYEIFRKGVEAPRLEPVRNVGRKVGRNEKCPCGSDRKFKVCCGRQAEMGGRTS